MNLHPLRVPVCGALLLLPVFTMTTPRSVCAEDVPLINVAEFTFITVARDSVRNVANNPRWATSHWADTWLAG